MVAPKCRQCSKIIPDGFVDCPWCGAKQSPTLPPTAFVEDGLSEGRKALYFILWLASTSLVFLSCWIRVRMETIDRGPEYLGRLIGACAVTFLIPVLGVFLYYKFRHRDAPDAKKLMLISTWALIPAFLGLSNAISQQGIRNAAEVRHVGELLKYSASKGPNAVRDKWDRAIVQVFSDLLALNEQYVSDVSKTEIEAPKLLTLESFRDAKTIRQESSRVRALLEINEKYASVDSLEKMKSYVNQMDASSEEKRQFLEGVASSTQGFAAKRQRVSVLERTWLRTASELYEFALTHEKEYSWEGKHLIFRNDDTLKIFNSKLTEARKQYSDFLQAHHDFRQSQDAAMAQVGLQRSDFLPTKPK